jgi:hypothetical protein
MTLANRMRSVSLLGLLPLLLPLSACLPEIPEGRVSCVVDDDCPRALTCRAARCYSSTSPQDADLVDTGIADIGALDSAMPDTGMPDTGMLDTGMLDTGMLDTGMLDMGTVDPTLPWTSQFGTNADDTVCSVTSSASGDAVVVGVVADRLADAAESYGEMDVYVRRYSSSGVVAWTRQFGGPEQDHATGAGLDAVGNVYVAYRSPHGSGDPSEHLVKLGPTGADVWTRTLAFGDDEVVVNAIAVDASGNVYLAGELSGDSATGTSDAFVRKYSTSGTELWTRQVTTNSDRGDPEDSREYASALAVDSSGNVFIGGSAGKSLGGGPSTGSGPFFLRMLDASGGVLWTRQFGPSSTDVFEDALSALVVSADGATIYAAGTVRGALPANTHAGGADAFVQAYTTNGARSWAHQFGANDDDFGNGVAVGANGDVYVVGSTKSALAPAPHLGGSDVFVRRLAHGSGAPVWTRSYGTSDDDTGRAVQVTMLGALLIGGTTKGTLPTATSAGNQDAFVMALPL